MLIHSLLQNQFSARTYISDFRLTHHWNVKGHNASSTYKKRITNITGKCENFVFKLWLDAYRKSLKGPDK